MSALIGSSTLLNDFRSCAQRKVACGNRRRRRRRRGGALLCSPLLRRYMHTTQGTPHVLDTSDPIAPVHRLRPCAIECEWNKVPTGSASLAQSIAPCTLLSRSIPSFVKSTLNRRCGRGRFVLACTLSQAQARPRRHSARVIWPTRLAPQMSGLAVMSTSFGMNVLIVPWHRPKAQAGALGRGSAAAILPLRYECINTTTIIKVRPEVHSPSFGSLGP
jgi:hypothetical protein